MEKKWKIDYNSPFTKMATPLLRRLLEKGLTEADLEYIRGLIDSRIAFMSAQNKS